MSDEAGDGAARKPLYKNPFVLAFVVGAVILTLLPFAQRRFLDAPPPMASLGSWTLVNQDGEAIGSETLKGQVWIGSFFFARCPSVCPKQQANFKSLQKHIEDLAENGKTGIHLVSFSVDPEYDTPEVLKAYARKMEAAPAHWSFVTGPIDRVTDLLVKRMFVPIGERQELPGGLFDISHSAKFVLVDQNGDVRGFWDDDENGRGNLINAARLLHRHGADL